MNQTQSKVKLEKTGPTQVTLVFPEGTAERLRLYVPVDDLLAVIRCPQAEVEGQELEEIEVGDDAYSGGGDL